MKRICLWVTIVVAVILFASYSSTTAFAASAGLTFKQEVEIAFSLCQQNNLGLDPFSLMGACEGKAFIPIFDWSGIGGDKLQLTENGHFWLPIKGKMTIGDYFILVEFKLDQDMIDFFNTKFLNSEARMPIGLEVDINDIDGVLNSRGQVVGINFPDEAGITADTGLSDKHNSYGAVIRFPNNLEADRIYGIAFYPEGSTWYKPWSSDKVLRNDGRVNLMFQVNINAERATDMVDAYDAGDHALQQFRTEDLYFGDVYDFFAVESDGFNSMRLPADTVICWNGKKDDDIGCEKGNPFFSPTGENVISTGGVIADDVKKVVIDNPKNSPPTPPPPPAKSGDANVKSVLGALHGSNDLQHELLVPPGTVIDLWVEGDNKSSTAKVSNSRFKY